MNNYPDDIDRYSNDPRSPLYEAPPCENFGQEFDDCDCCESCGLPLVECECEEQG